MKKKLVPVLVVLGLIVLIVLIIIGSVLFKKYSPSKEKADLNEHYNISEENDVIVVLDRTDTSVFAKLIDGKLFVPYDFLHNEIDSRFYWDSNESLLLYTNPETVYTAKVGESTYSDTKTQTDFESPVACMLGEGCYVNLDYALLFSNFSYKYNSNPNRIVVTTKFETVNIGTVKKSAALREKGGIKSPIMRDLEKGETVFILEDFDTFSYVMSEDGFLGFMKKNCIKDRTELTLTSDYVPVVATHIKKSFDICLGWHSVYSQSANNNISSMLSSSKAINVISPTWFYVNDNDGNLYDKASSSYVNYCHMKNVEVWALVSNFDNKDVNTTYILTHTSVRNNLVNKIVSSAISYNLDGINLDFESISPEVGDAYIQFVRELSIKLRNNGIALSIDNYVPTEYTAFYNRREQAEFADYLIMMGYDQHYAGSEEAGSVAALDWVTEGVNNTLAQGVPAEQLVLAIPFYTRLWCESPVTSEDDNYSISSQVLLMGEALSLIDRKGAEKTWDNSCGQFYAEYTESGNTYKIWLEDSNSIEEKLKVAKDHSLAGTAFWRLGFERSSTWDTISKYYN